MVQVEEPYNFGEAGHELVVVVAVVALAELEEARCAVVQRLDEEACSRLVLEPLRAARRPDTPEV